MTWKIWLSFYAFVLHNSAPTNLNEVGVCTHVAVWILCAALQRCSALPCFALLPHVHMCMQAAGDCVAFSAVCVQQENALLLLQQQSKSIVGGGTDLVTATAVTLR